MISATVQPSEVKIDVEPELLTPSDFIGLNEDYNNFIEAFNYHNLNRCLNGKVFLNYLDQYEAYNLPSLTGANFIHLTHKIPGPYGKTQNKRGFKFHISLDHSTGNIEKGWDIVINHLINHKVSLSKIICFEALPLMAASHTQCGKEITIYAYFEKRPSSAWQNLIKDITLDFVANQIKPGPLPPSDTSVKGSNYFSYRDDTYREESDLNLAKPKEDLFSEFDQIEEGYHSDSSNKQKNDPFKQIEIIIPNQFPRPNPQINAILSTTEMNQKLITDEKPSVSNVLIDDSESKITTNQIKISNETGILSLFSHQSTGSESRPNSEIKEEIPNRNPLKKYSCCVLQ